MFLINNFFVINFVPGTGLGILHILFSIEEEMIHFFYYRGSKKTQFTDLHYAAIVNAKEKGKFERIIVHEDCPADSNSYMEARKLPYVEWRKTQYDSGKDQEAAIQAKRAEILLQEGGVVADLNFLILRPFTSLLWYSWYSNQKKKRGKMAHAPKPYANEETRPLPVKLFYPVSSSNKTFLEGADISLADSYAIYIWGNLQLKDLQHTSVASFLPNLSPIRATSAIVSFA